MAHQIVELLYQSWADVDHAIAGLKPEDAEMRVEGLSRISWVMGHLGQQVDSWVNVRFAGAPPHTLLGSELFRTGSSGESPPWHSVLDAVGEARGRTKRYLDDVTEAHLDKVVPYTGSIAYLRPGGMKLSYALMRCAAHHFEHAGEILTIRSVMGVPGKDNWMWGEALM